MPKHRKGAPTQELAAEYAGGATSTEIAARYGMTHGAVIGRLRRAGVQIRPGKRRTAYDDPERAAAIITAYRSGLPIADVAARFNIGQSTVARALKAHRVEPRPHGLRRQTVRLPSDLAAIGYLAGIFDGEGNLQFKKKHGGRSIGCKMAIYSTTPGLMRWLLRTVGGNARFDTKRTERKGWLPIGIWEIYRAQDVAVLLRVLLPHLIVKKQQAESALRLFAERFELHDSPPQITQSSLGEPAR